jgi:hypothetical protein
MFSINQTTPSMASSLTALYLQDWAADMATVMGISVYSMGNTDSMISMGMRVSNAPKIYIAGHRGMVGSVIVRQLLNNGHPKERIVTHTHGELDLIDQSASKALSSQQMFMTRVILEY